MMTVPTSGDIRQARAEVARLIIPRLKRLHGPTLAAFGLLTAFADLAALTGLRKTQRPDWKYSSPFDEDHHSAGIVPSSVSATYYESIYRGWIAVQILAEQRKVRDALREVKKTTDKMMNAIDTAADDLHDTTEEAFGRASLSICTGREYAVSTCIKAATSFWHLWSVVPG